MSGELTIFKTGAAAVRSKVFDQSKVNADAIDAGIGAGFAKITYKGAKWGIKYQGNTQMLRRFDAQNRDDGPSPNLDIVIVNAAEHPSKYWYEGKYQEGDITPPDCFSSNGIVPDVGAPKKQSPTCAGCKNNAWGSAMKDGGVAGKGKACTDHKRLVVVPVGDITNKAYGGPMLMQVPPTSLKKLGPYKQKLALAGFNFNEVWTRVTFDATAAYPLFEFDAIRQLSDLEARQVLEVESDPLSDRILNSAVEGAEGYDQPEEVAQTSTEVPQPVPGPTVTTPPPTPTPTPMTMTGGGMVPPPPTPPVAAAAATPTPLTPEQQKIAELEAALAAAKAATVPEKPKRQTKARTPAVTPTPTDSAAATAAATPTPTPAPVPTPTPTPPPVTAAGNGHAVDPEVGEKIGALIGNLL
jgi:hypothetical protein